MRPALNPDVNQSDFVLVNCWSTRDYRVNRGDIVAFRSLTDPQKTLIKRVVAVQSEQVRTRHGKRQTIRRGFFWAEGDNATRSTDSNTFGPVPLGLVVGKASLIIWPPTRWRLLDRSDAGSGEAALTEDDDEFLYANPVNNDAVKGDYVTK